MLLRVENLNKHFFGLAAVNDVSFRVNRGEILGIIGPNGAGKSTLFNLISGFLRPSSGAIYLEDLNITRLKPHRITELGIARTFQSTLLFERLRVVDNLAVGCKLCAQSGFWHTILHTGRWKENKEKTAKSVMEIIDFIKLAPKGHDSVSTLSQEEKKRLSIGLTLTANPKIVLLDEPTAGLIEEDIHDITDLIKKMKSLGITICLIEHKMRTLMNLADRIVVLNYGTLIAEGTPEEIINNQEVIDAYLGREDFA